MSSLILSHRTTLILVQEKSFACIWMYDIGLRGLGGIILHGQCGKSYRETQFTERTSTLTLSFARESERSTMFLFKLQSYADNFKLPNSFYWMQMHFLTEG